MSVFCIIIFARIGPPLVAFPTFHYAIRIALLNDLKHPVEGYRPGHRI
jgi:hypothetical protein